MMHKEVCPIVTVMMSLTGYEFGMFEILPAFSNINELIQYLIK